LPACWEWHEGEPLPEGLTFVKGTLPENMYIKICLNQISPPKISVDKKNIAEIDVDVRGVLKWTFKRMAVPPEEVERKCDEWENYVKTSCDKFEVEVNSDLPEERICFVLPTKWRFRGILKNNIPIPFTISDTNKVCFTVTHTSPTLITIQLVSDITQMTSTIINSVVSAFAILMVVSLLISTVKSLKEAVK